MHGFSRYGSLTPGPGFPEFRRNLAVLGENRRFWLNTASELLKSPDFGRIGGIVRVLNCPSCRMPMNVVEKAHTYWLYRCTVCGKQHSEPKEPEVKLEPADLEVKLEVESG
jgi:hypothetical protein